MAEKMRSLAMTLLEAAKVHEENERLKREMADLRYEVDKNLQRQRISQLEDQRWRDKALIEKLTLKAKNSKQKAGQQKHRADVLEAKLEALIKKTQAVIQHANGNGESPDDQ